MSNTAMDNDDYVGVDIHVGNPPHTKKIHWYESFEPDVSDSINRFIPFYNFEQLPWYELIESPEFWAFGHKWKVKLEKKNQNGEEDGDGPYVTVHLFLCRSSSVHPIRGVISFRATDGSFNKFSEPDVTNFKFEPPFPTDDADLNITGERNLEYVDKIRNILDRGHLTVKLTMARGREDPGYVPNHFYTEHKIRQLMLNIMSDEDTADVSFDVKGRTFYAHLSILKAVSPNLVRTLNLEEHTKSNPVTIEDVEPDIFEKIIGYIYGANIQVAEAKDGKAIIDAADKYGVDSLKLEADKFYVRLITITVDNLAELLLYADAKNCPNLKEAAMDFFTQNGDEVAASSSFESLRQSGRIMREIVTAMARQARLK